MGGNKYEKEVSSIELREEARLRRAPLFHIFTIVIPGLTGNLREIAV